MRGSSSRLPTAPQQGYTFLDFLVGTASPACCALASLAYIHVWELGSLLSHDTPLKSYWADIRGRATSTIKGNSKHGHVRRMSSWAYGEQVCGPVELDQVARYRIPTPDLFDRSEHVEKRVIQKREEIHREKKRVNTLSGMV